MATQNIPLWIDPFENKLYAGITSTQSAPTPLFKQGDEVTLELFLLKRSLTSGFEVVNFPEDCTIRVAIGKIDALPTGGSLSITYGANTTGAIAYDATASAIQTALNALASVTSAGGVTVTLVSNSMFQVAFNSVGVRSGFTADSAGLVPTSSVKIIELRAGTASLTALYLFKVKQSAAVFQNSWDDSPAPSITVTTLVANQSKRVTIDPTPLSGTWTLTTTQAIAPKVLVDGDETNVPTYWDETVTARWGAFTTNFTGPADEPVYQMSVIQVGQTTWDFTVNTDYATPVGYTMPFTVSGNFTKFPSKVGTMNFNTVEVEYLLAGANTATAVFEIEIEKSNGERWTALQTNCTIVNDLIDQVDFDPLTLDSCVTEAPVDGTPYLRKDGAWVSSIDGGTY